MIARYPKPSDVGGKLIRNVVGLFRENGIELPLRRPILIATSGGIDSMSLAHLISVYGRRVISPDLVTLLHFDHQWRQESGTIEKEMIADFARDLGVGFRSVTLKTQRQDSYSKNLEEDARLKRNEFYRLHAGDRKKAEFVLTAHHADDVVETLIWRFFRGELHLQSEGILFRDHQTLRPFLKVFKEELYCYAKDEKVPFLEDPGNQDSGQMRAFIRTQLKPLLLKQFPGYRSSVLTYSAVFKKNTRSGSKN